MLPLLYLNLGGEMMYIIDQRLIAQKIAPDKSSKGKQFYYPTSSGSQIDIVRALMHGACGPEYALVQG